MLDLLRPTFGDRLVTSQAERDAHGTDEGWHAPLAPDAVVYVTSTEEVVEVVQACAQHRVPLIPFGAGTSLEGHVAAVRGGISVDLSLMDRVLAVNSDDLDCVVQPGVHR